MSRILKLLTTAVALIALGAVARAWASPVAAPEIATVVAEQLEASTTKHRDWIARVYGSAEAGAVWFADSGPRPALAVGLRELGAAGERGLDPADYGVDRLRDLVAAVERSGRSARSVALADVAMTAAVLRFLGDLQSGRVRPQEIEPHYRVPAKDASFVATLRDAVAGDRLAAAVDAVEPSFPVYGRLKGLLGHYRRLAAMPPLALPPLARPKTKVVPGERYEGVPALHALLVRLGDLPSTAQPPAGDVYSNALAEGVARFQERHGLAPDGVLGKQTLAELGVRSEARLRQIELSLERLRWLPEVPRGPLVAINIPSFRLWAFADGATAERATLSMPVIVGRAMRGETPMFIGAMRYVEFSPYWNVPPDIMRNELLPQLARDASLLQRGDMELVAARGTGPAVDVLDAPALERLRSGELRLRQRPGPRNALDGVKFALPNTMDVYLHGTPASELFERSRRDFSHGCIRVRDPAALARFVLRDRPQWTPAAIEAAMRAGTSRTVALEAPIPVVIFYTTAIVDAGGVARFLPDIYGHDRRLDRALASLHRAAG